MATRRAPQVNYHADGSKFRNDFIMCPLLAPGGETRYFISVHKSAPALDWSLGPPPHPNIRDHFLGEVAIA